MLEGKDSRMVKRDLRRIMKNAASEEPWGKATLSAKNRSPELLMASLREPIRDERKESRKGRSRNIYCRPPMAEKPNWSLRKRFKERKRGSERNI